MAFPAATAGGGHSGANVASYPISLPDSLQVGELVIIVVTKDATGAITWPGAPSWTSLLDQASDSHFFSIRWRRIDGTEGWGGTGNSITVSHASGTEGYAHSVLRITGAHGSSAPELAFALDNAGTTTPDPPSLNPSAWDVEDTLWFAAMAWDNRVSNALSDWPDNYTTIQDTSGWSSSHGVGVAVCARELAAASDDPATFTIPVAEEWITATFAIRPAGAAGPTADASQDTSLSGSANAVVTKFATASHTITLGTTASATAGSNPEGTAAGSITLGATAAAVATKHATGSQTTALEATASATAGTTTDAVFIDEGTFSPIDVFATPYDGIRGPNDAEGYYTPLASRGDYIYLAENTWAPNTLTGHVSQILKATHAEVDQRSLGTQSWIPGSGVAVAGHCSAAVGVNGVNGRVVAHRGGHAQSIDLRYETSAGTLSTISTLTDPAGAGTRADYRRFWRAPDGTLWLYVRGNDGKGELYKWDDGTTSFARIGGAGPFSDFGSGAGSYAGNLTFDSTTGDIYVVTEALLTATSGFPGNFIGCAKSTDNGATWTTLSGTAAALPLGLTDHNAVAGGTSSDEVVAAQIALDANGNPFIIFGWTNAGEGDAYLATWTARWNGTNWTYVRLYEQIGDGTDQLGQWQNSKIIPQVTSYQGILIIVMKEVGQSVTQRLVLLMQFPGDPDNTWHRWVLHNSDLYTGAYIDQWALPDDGLLRLYPVTSGDLAGYDQSSELWELDILGISETAIQTTIMGADASMTIARIASADGTTTLAASATVTTGSGGTAAHTTTLGASATLTVDGTATATGSVVLTAAASAYVTAFGAAASLTALAATATMITGDGAPEEPEILTLTAVASPLTLRAIPDPLTLTAIEED